MSKLSNIAPSNVVFLLINQVFRFINVFFTFYMILRTINIKASILVFYTNIYVNNLQKDNKIFTIVYVYYLLTRGPPDPVLLTCCSFMQFMFNQVEIFIVVTWRPSSVNFSHFKLLLRNHLADWNRT